MHSLRSQCWKMLSWTKTCTYLEVRNENCSHRLKQIQENEWDLAECPELEDWFSGKWYTQYQDKSIACPVEKDWRMCFRRVFHWLQLPTWVVFGMVNLKQHNGIGLLAIYNCFQWH